MAKTIPPGPQTTLDDQYFFARTRFEGSLSGHGSTIPVGFDAWIDELGVLHLQLDTMAYSPEAGALSIHQPPGSSVDLLELTGTSAEGHRLISNSFCITHLRHGSEYELQGDCYDVEIAFPQNPGQDTSHDTRAWRVRQLSTFRPIARDTPLGRMVIGGPQQGQGSQDPNGFIAIHRPEGDTNENWWEESDRLLTHVARVLSFASDTYLRPIIEERYDKGRVTVRVARQGRASSPYMAPFHFLNMQPIFDCACQSYFDRYAEIEQLDAAIRWLTAPVAYDESRLINAMSALENILARCGIDRIDYFLGNAAFKKVAKAVREALNVISAPEAMIPKIAELNRRSLSDKVEALLATRGIRSDDFPEGWLKTVIQHRNVIVHTGISQDYGDTEPDTLDHTIWVREVVTRIILDRLGFVGAYRSWLHHDEQLHFPECILLERWVRQQETSTANETPPE
ncbi:hypothetical protein [Blastomonas fulva]|uniref:hypothetical protein n=1 Tax=Blastomonas fulva TaxID=1550728 RepID=UPI004034498F